VRGAERVLFQLVQQLVSCRERSGWGKEREGVCVCVSRILILSCRFFSSSSRDLGLWGFGFLVCGRIECFFSCCSKEPELVFGLQCVCVCVVLWVFLWLLLAAKG
jgi:hypothetical protein